ncbi:MAG: hypothetical protein AB9891_06330 [Anaerolineaceae bacterium]
MRNNSGKYNKSSAAFEEYLDKYFSQAKAQFGDAVRSFWLYDDALCPACNRHPIGTIKFKGEEALSLNAFIYRQRGVLIGYFLCETCARQVFQDAQKNPYIQTPVHAEIERNLIIAYHAHRPAK